MKLRTHSVQYAYKLVARRTRRALEETYVTSHSQGQEWGTASTD